MKKLLCITALFAILLTACGKKQLNTLEEIIERDMLYAGVRIDAAPFGHINETGENEGFDIDLARSIAEKITGSPDKVEFVPLAASERIEALTSGKVDMVIAAMSNTPERQIVIDFSIPYYTAGQTVLVRKTSRINSYADLRNRTVIIVSGSTAKHNLRRIVPSAVLAEYPNYNEAFEAFRSGAGDALCADDTFIAGFTSGRPGYKTLNSKISAEYYSIGIQKTEDKALQKRLNSIIDEMKQSGKLKKFKNKRNLK